MIDEHTQHRFSVSKRCLKVFLSLLVLFAIFEGGCKGTKSYKGEKIKLNYRNVDIEKEDWIKIDSIKFEHIGDRREAESVEFPLPSKQVRALRNETDTLYRDYNPRSIPIYLYRQLISVNERIPKMERYKTTNKALMMYSGVLELMKNDSTTITVETNRGYGAEISATNVQK